MPDENVFMNKKNDSKFPFSNFKFQCITQQNKTNETTSMT